MSKDEEIKTFTIEGYKRISKKAKLSGEHVLINREDNFITIPDVGFEYHRWASSLKSSQAFAYNIFSGVKDREFEFHMEVFNTDAQIDVKIEDRETIKLFEVKMFEIVKMEMIEFENKYFTKQEYKRSDIAEPFINFLHEVINYFEKENRRIYGGGVKQLCSHLLGILNIMDSPIYAGKKFILYSLCFDNPFSKKIERDIINYKETLNEFKILVDKFLKEIEVNSRIEYYGFLPASECINEKLLGKKNYDYVMARYFH